jgi:hypothetical protein
MRVTGIGQIKETLDCRHCVALAGSGKAREAHRTVSYPAAAKHQGKIDG